MAYDILKEKVEAKFYFSINQLLIFNFFNYVKRNFKFRWV